MSIKNTPSLVPRPRSVSPYLAAIISGDEQAILNVPPDSAADAMLLAAENGQLDILRCLHKAGYAAPANALIAAAANGRLEIVRWLHQQGHDICAMDHLAIKVATRENQFDVVRYLHENGSDLQAATNSWQRLVLSRAATELVDYLARHAVAPAGPQLMDLLDAIQTGTFASVKACICNIDVGFYSGLLSRVAAERGDPGILQLLHQSGCDVVHADEQIALRTAAALGHVPIMIYLHEKGADLRAGNEAALRMAVENGRLYAVAFLAERGADIRCIDQDTLELIRLGGHIRTFNYLTDSGLDAIKCHRPAIAAIQEELLAAQPVYRPSKLWEYFNEINMEQLRRGGMHGFKRTINQNYFNFLPYSLFDPQLSRLVRWWLSNLSLTPFKAKAFDPDVIPDSSKLLPVDRRVFTLSHRYRSLSWLARTTGIDIGRKVQLELYRMLIAMLADYTDARDRLNLARNLPEPRTGSPIDVYIGTRLVSQDLAHSILECNSIIGEIDPEERSRVTRIAEVGAGYGRLGYVLMKAVPCQYVVFDIPPGLYVSQWYLGETFPDKRIFRFRHFDRFEDIVDELSQADMAFFSPNQIEMFPDGYFDITANISSLHELRPDQIDNLLKQIYRITRRYVYLKQYKEYINPYDGLRLLEDSYALAPGWKYRYYRDDGVDSRFFETLIEREGTSLPVPAPRKTRQAPEPTVSILLANFNHAKYLRTSLAGICSQTRQAFEIIVVDDGSTDDSIAVVEEFAQNFPNLRLLRNGINRGQHYSIQRALLAARGDYIVWAASDDLLLPDFIEKSLSMLVAYPAAGLCFSQLAVFVDGTTETRHYTGKTQGVAFDYGSSPRYISPDELKSTLSQHYLWMSGNTVMARRRALLEIGGFDGRLKWHGDWFAFYVVALRYGACVIPETLAMMRERQDTYSKTGMDNPQEQMRVLKSLFDTVKSPKYRDLLPVFQGCPSLLGLFGRRAFYTAMRNPRHWNLVWPLGWWLIPRYLLRTYGKARHQLSVGVNQTKSRIRKLVGY